MCLIKPSKFLDIKLGGQIIKKSIEIKGKCRQSMTNAHNFSINLELRT